jgi:hypothetical protein
VSIIFCLKLVLVPLLILGITLAGRRWGPAVAGWLSAFPVVAAPVLLFISLDQGARFAASAAAGTLAAVLAILVFGISYAWAATRFSWGISLTAAFVCYLGAVACLTLWAPSVGVVAPIVVAALLGVSRLFPEAPLIVASSAPANDIAWRMAAGAALVVSLTHFSPRLGPQLSGLFAMFPIMLSVLVVFSHRHAGAGFAIKLLRGTVLGYYGFATFCVVLSLSLSIVGIGAAFALSLSCAAIVQAISRVYLLRAQPTTQTDRA